MQRQELEQKIADLLSEFKSKGGDSDDVVVTLNSLLDYEEEERES